LLNVALCFVLIPHFGAMGAAIASATALVFESAWLFLIAKIHLGLHCLIFGRPKGS
jgi:O-antigen/teichoic acid export membrane protein